mmetsp:Transcript_74736/g.188950  ORF Transcript_74736/g.188950 Transcript_74736/m.188950 type:complete len:326 (+) Transcript_74736:666-1643(+)
MVVVHPPNVDLRQAVDCPLRRQPSVHRGDRPAPVVRPDRPRGFFDVLHAGLVGEAYVEAVVVPLVPQLPHQDGRVVAHAVHVVFEPVGVQFTGHVHRRHGEDAPLPEQVEDEAVRERVVDADGVDASLCHHGNVLLDKVPWHGVWPVLTLLHRAPVHALDVQGLPIDEDLAASNLYDRPRQGAPRRGLAVACGGVAEAVACVMARRSEGRKGLARRRGLRGRGGLAPLPGKRGCAPELDERVLLPERLTAACAFPCPPTSSAIPLDAPLVSDRPLHCSCCGAGTAAAPRRREQQRRQWHRQRQQHRCCQRVGAVEASNRLAARVH